MIFSDLPLEQFISEVYIGCLQCQWCLLSICNDEVLKDGCIDVKMDIHRLAQHFGNTISILEHAMKEQDISIPDTSRNKHIYDLKLECLTHRTDRYLALKFKPYSRSEYDRLSSHVVLIKDFQVLSEIGHALHFLRVVFRIFAVEQANKVDHRRDEFMLFSQMEESFDLSPWSCCSIANNTT